MPRVKGGKITRQRRKKILKLAKGYFGSKRTLYKTANEQVMRSLMYAYRDRKQRKREFRKLWISRINAAAKLNGMKYSTLIYGLSLAGVIVNRKMLADIAVNEPNDFKEYCLLAQKGLNGDAKPHESKSNTTVKPNEKIKTPANEVVPNDAVAYEIYQITDESNTHNKEWAVKKTGSTRVSKYFKTKKEATEYVKGLQK